MNPRLKIRRDSTPLFDFAEAKQRAEEQRNRGMQRVAESAENREPGFHERALAHVECFARTHESFLAEDVRSGFDMGTADGRAFGPVMKLAEARGLIVADGAAPANSSNRSLKVRWRSKVFGGAN